MEFFSKRPRKQKAEQRKMLVTCSEFPAMNIFCPLRCSGGRMYCDVEESRRYLTSARLERDDC